MRGLIRDRVLSAFLILFIIIGFSSSSCSRPPVNEREEKEISAYIEGEANDPIIDKEEISSGAIVLKGVLKGHDQGGIGLSFSSNNRYLAVITSNRRLYLWDIQKNKSQCILSPLPHGLGL